MLKSSLCDHSDAYTLVNGAVTIAGRREDQAVRQANKKVQE